MVLLAKQTKTSTGPLPTGNSHRVSVLKVEKKTPPLKNLQEAQRHRGHCATRKREQTHRATPHANTPAQNCSAICAPDFHDLLTSLSEICPRGTKPTLTISLKFKETVAQLTCATSCLATCGSETSTVGSHILPKTNCPRGANTTLTFPFKTDALDRKQKGVRTARSVHKTS